MKTIIAPTDFSPVSLNAVHYAADMATAVNASLTLLHVSQVPMAFSEVPYPSENLEELSKIAEKKIEQLKKEIAESKGEKLKIYTELRTGVIIAEIEDTCEKLQPYAVVMGTQGAGALERLFFGSNTLAATKKLEWPLVVVPREAKFKAIKKIGLACDLKKVVETSPVDVIKAIVKEFHSELHVIHVNMEGERRYGPEIIEESGMLQEMLDELHPRYHFLNNTDVDEGLSDFAERNQLDLLIVIPKKHTLISKLFHKSHTKQMVLHTHVPVMAVHE
jgi:nucleotide-binding universal stress UspA family protein